MAEWDPTQFIITVGSDTITEFAPSTFIKADFDEDQYSKEIGADGAGCRIRNANQGGYFEITLLKSSLSNDVLSALAVLDRATAQGVVPVQVKDMNGTAVAAAAHAWITRIPALERGKELGDVTWKLDTTKLEILVGGIPQTGTTQ